MDNSLKLVVAAAKADAAFVQHMEKLLASMRELTDVERAFLTAHEALHWVYAGAESFFRRLK